jgi:hypothetical protein
MSCQFGHLTADCVNGFGSLIVNLLAKYHITMEQHLYELYKDPVRLQSFVQQLTPAEHHDWTVHAPNQEMGIQALTKQLVPRYSFEPRNARIDTPMCELQWVNENELDDEQQYLTEAACVAANPLEMVLRLAKPYMDDITEESVLEEYARLATLPPLEAKIKVRYLFESIRIYNTHHTYLDQVRINPWKLSQYTSVDHQLWRCAFHSRFFESCFTIATFYHAGLPVPMSLDAIALVNYGFIHDSHVALDWDDGHLSLIKSVACSESAVQQQVIRILQERQIHFNLDAVLVTNITRGNAVMIKWIITDMGALIGYRPFNAMLRYAPEMMTPLLHNFQGPMSSRCIFFAIKFKNVKFLEEVLKIHAKTPTLLSDEDISTFMAMAFQDPSKVLDIIMEMYGANELLYMHLLFDHATQNTNILRRLVERGIPTNDMIVRCMIDGQSPENMLFVLRMHQANFPLENNLLQYYYYVKGSWTKYREVYMLLIAAPDMDITFDNYAVLQQAIIYNDLEACDLIMKVMGVMTEYQLWGIAELLQPMFPSAIRKNRLDMVKFMLGFPFVFSQLIVNQITDVSAHSEYVDIYHVLKNDARFIASTNKQADKTDMMWNLILSSSSSDHEEHDSPPSKRSRIE